MANELTWHDVLAGLTVLVRRNTKNDHHDGGDDHES